MKISIASDHGGYELKDYIIDYMESEKFTFVGNTLRKYEITDLGCYSRQSVDYPIYGHVMGNEITDGKADMGIIICGTGIGISIAANRFTSVRAALCYDITTARLAREHNDANVLALGARQTAPQLACEIVDVFFSTKFAGVEGDRHERRVSMLSVEPDRVEEHRANILKSG